MGLLWGVAFHWLDLALFAGFYVVCAFGTTIGFHRYFTHRGVETSAPIKAILAVLGCMSRGSTGFPPAEDRLRPSNAHGRP